MKDTTTENATAIKSNLSPYSAEATPSRPEVARPNGHKLLQLQRRYGNRYVQRMVAQRQVEEDDESVSQAKFAPGVALQAQVAASRNPTGLPDGLKAGVENLSGFSLDDVKVHYNSPKPADVQALAYTQGTDIHVGPGQEKHLPHEAWHVVQQKQGRVRPTMQVKSVAINNDIHLEGEADAMGEKASLRASHDLQKPILYPSILSPNDGITMQRYSFKNWGVTNHDNGKRIRTDLIEPGDRDLGRGSKVSEWPDDWWPEGPAKTADDFLRENFVQGHLLNQKLGGPGDERYNLTPLTRSANSTMAQTIEWWAKYHLGRGRAIEYDVIADYTSHPNANAVGASSMKRKEKDKLENYYLDKMAGKIKGEVTAYERDNGDWSSIKNQPPIIEVFNEGTALTGSFDDYGD